jgi:hypothetical protein
MTLVVLVERRERRETRGKERKGKERERAGKEEVRGFAFFGGEVEGIGMRSLVRPLVCTPLNLCRAAESYRSSGNSKQTVNTRAGTFGSSPD